MVCKGCYTNLPPGAMVCEVCGKEPPTSPCPHCKTPIIQGRRFCSNCRTPINKKNTPKVPAPNQVLCPQCQNPLAPHRRFCNQCGSRQHSVPLTHSSVAKVTETKEIHAQTATLTEIPAQSPPKPKVVQERKGISSTRPSATVASRPRETIKKSEELQKKSPTHQESRTIASQVCPHCQNTTDAGRLFCPACHKRMIPLDSSPHKTAEVPQKQPISTKKITPKPTLRPSPMKKPEVPPRTPLVEEKISTMSPQEYLAPIQKRPPIRFCPDCFGKIEGEICDFCLDHPPLPPIPSLPDKKPLQPPKIALVTASVAGVALCMGLGQMMLVDEDLPSGNSNQVDVNLNYPSNETQPSRPTESGEILPDTPPETPNIADGTEIPSINSSETSDTPPSQVETIPPQEETPLPEEPQAETPSQEEVQETSGIHPNQASGSCQDSEMALLYRPVLHSYGYGLEFSWESQDYSSANLNPKMAEQSFASASYTFWDIDGNGTPELIIGTPETGGLIMELYTISNGELTLLLRGNDRERYVLCNDGLIAHDDDNGTTLTLELRGNYLTIVEDQRQKDPYHLTDQAQIPFTPIAEYYFA